MGRRWRTDLGSIIRPLSDWSATVWAVAHMALSPRRMSNRCSFSAVLALLACLAGSAQATDWGAWRAYPDDPGLYQEKCARCHEGAGHFAPQRLALVEGALVSKRSGRSLHDLLPGHPTRLTQAELDSLVATLTTIVVAGGQFQQRCAICHDSAEALARSRLVRRDGRLFGRYSGRDISDFLNGHGRLDGAGAAFFEDVLRRYVPTAED